MHLRQRRTPVHAVEIDLNRGGKALVDIGRRYRVQTRRLQRSHRCHGCHENASSPGQPCCVPRSTGYGGLPCKESPPVYEAIFKGREDAGHQFYEGVEEPPVVVQELFCSSAVLDGLVHGGPVDGYFAATVLHAKKIRQGTVRTAVSPDVAEIRIEAEHRRQVVVPLIQLQL